MALQFWNDHFGAQIMSNFFLLRGVAWRGKHPDVSFTWFVELWHSIETKVGESSQFRPQHSLLLMKLDFGIWGFFPKSLYLYYKFDYTLGLLSKIDENYQHYTTTDKTTQSLPCIYIRICIMLLQQRLLFVDIALHCFYQFFVFYYYIILYLL